MRNNTDAVGLATIGMGLAGIIAITMSNLSNWWLLTVPPLSVFAVVAAVLITDWLMPDDTREEFDHDESPTN